jgi:hypothetical protein
LAWRPVFVYTPLVAKGVPTLFLGALRTKRAFYVMAMQKETPAVSGAQHPVFIFGICLFFVKLSEDAH